MNPATERGPVPLFHEAGASWYWVLAGPAAGIAMLAIEKTSGYGWQLLVPGIFFVLVTGFVAVQVKAARIHTSVELTEQTLRQGTETIRVADIVAVYPPPEHPAASGKELAKWQSARAIGELVGVPRGRVGIGLRLTGGRVAQAWARRHRQLRAALTTLVEQRGEPAEPEMFADDGEDDGLWR